MKSVEFSKMFISIVVLINSTLLLGKNCPTPVGGSEHSYGIPSPASEQGKAIAAFLASDEISAKIALIKKHGYCPVDLAPSVDLQEQSISQNFVDSSSLGIVITAAYHIHSQGKVSIMPGSFDSSLFGNTIDLPEQISSILFESMNSIGIVDERGVMGSVELFSPKLKCTQNSDQNQTSSCYLFKSGKARRLDKNTSKIIATYLVEAGAFEGPQVVGQFKLALALTQCERGVYPGAQTTCSALIEF